MRVHSCGSYGYILRAHINRHTLLNNVMPCIIVGYEVEYFVIMVVIIAPSLKNRTKKTKQQPPTTMSMVAWKYTLIEKSLTLNEVVSTQCLLSVQY